MPINSIGDLVDIIRKVRLLRPAHLDELGRFQDLFAEPRAMAKDLLQRGWLTAYQINQLFQGNGAHLVLGQYLLLERLGEGGMGQVFKARHQRLERTVALKVIRKDRLSHPDAIHRFQREARAAARLSHPNIVTIYDADEVSGTHFFAMEYVEGTDLSKLVKQRGPLPVAQACDYVRQAALGLQHAHEQGMVHRDIKPANLFLTAKGVVKILDMGLARLHGPTEEAHATQSLTNDGNVMGTPDYIAPEQALDTHTADIRADLYSLGCTLYFLLTSKSPYPGGTLAEKLIKHQMHEARPVEQLRCDVPPAVAAILRKLMAKRPEQRYQKPAELAGALEPFSAGRGSSASSGVSETIAYSPKAEAEQNTLGTGMTVGPQPPSATNPLATVCHPGKSRMKKHWRPAVALGVAMLVVLVVVGLVFFGHDPPQTRPGTGSEKGDAKATPKEYTNSLGMEFVLVPKGKFLMGGGGGTVGDKEVQIPHDFYLGKYEVTQGEWQAVMKVNLSHFSRSGGGRNVVANIGLEKLKKFPVENVSWNDAQEFLKRLNERAKRTGWRYRLPKEAEWEYACRGGPLSNQLEYGYDYYLDRPTNLLLPDMAKFAHEKGLKRTCKVGSYKPNRLGLYDMHGNVWEWCDDSEKVGGAGPARVIRGGSWLHGGQYCRAAYRSRGEPSYRDYALGLRLARVLFRGNK